MFGTERKYLYYDRHWWKEMRTSTSVFSSPSRQRIRTFPSYISDVKRRKGRCKRAEKKGQDGRKERKKNFSLPSIRLASTRQNRVTYAWPDVPLMRIIVDRECSRSIFSIWKEWRKHPLYIHRRNDERVMSYWLHPWMYIERTKSKHNAHARH